MRMPLVLSMMWRIGRARAARRISRICGWIVGSPPEICSRSGCPSLSTSRSSMPSISARLRVPVCAGEELAKQVGHVRLQCLVHLDEGEAAVLLVVGAEAAIVGAALVDAGVELERHVAGLEEIAAALPVARLGGDQRLLHAVLGAALLIEDALALLQDLRRHQAEADLAERGGLAEKDIGPRLAQRRRGRRSGADRRRGR